MKNPKNKQIIDYFKEEVKAEKEKLNLLHAQPLYYTKTDPNDQYLKKQQYNYKQKIAFYTQENAQLKKIIQDIEYELHHKTQCRIDKKISRKQSPKGFKIKQSDIETMQRQLNETINELQLMKSKIFTLTKERAVLSQLYKVTETEIRKDETEYIKVLIEIQKLTIRKQEIQSNFKVMISKKSHSARPSDEYQTQLIKRQNKTKRTIQSHRTVNNKSITSNSRSKSKFKQNIKSDFKLKPQKIQRKDQAQEEIQNQNRKALTLLQKQGYFLSSIEELNILQQKLQQEIKMLRNQEESKEELIKNYYLKMDLNKDVTKSPSQFQQLFQKNLNILEQIQLLKPKVLNIAKKYNIAPHSSILLKDSQFGLFLEKIQEKIKAETEVKPLIYPDMKQQNLEKMLRMATTTNQQHSDRILKYDQFLEQLL